MKRKIKLNRNVFDKNKFKETVDTSFSQLKVKPTQKFFDTSLATVNDFFVLYEELFYEIPKDGTTNSHEYLIQQSSEYTGFVGVNDEIQALLTEITMLREELLEKEKTIANLDIGSVTITENISTGTIT